MENQLNYEARPKNRVLSNILLPESAKCMPIVVVVLKRHCLGICSGRKDPCEANVSSPVTSEGTQDAIPKDRNRANQKENEKQGWEIA